MGRETVGAFLDGWLVSVKPTVRPPTRESYELYLRRHAKPVIGSKRLSALRPSISAICFAPSLRKGYRRKASSTFVQY
jgi:hypothetical protein